MTHTPRTQVTSSLRPAASRTAVLAITLVAVASLAGCYERVVGARGPGAGAVRVEQPYQSDSQLDRWIFGEETTPRHNQPRSDPGSWNGSR